MCTHQGFAEMRGMVYGHKGLLSLLLRIKQDAIVIPCPINMKGTRVHCPYYLTCYSCLFPIILQSNIEESLSEGFTQCLNHVFRFSTTPQLILNKMNDIYRVWLTIARRAELNKLNVVKKDNEEK